MKDKKSIGMPTFLADFMREGSTCYNQNSSLNI